jgi:hypothetical protein
MTIGVILKPVRGSRDVQSRLHLPDRAPTRRHISVAAARDELSDHSDHSRLMQLHDHRPEQPRTVSIGQSDSYKPV